jgi:hypothetical protein
VGGELLVRKTLTEINKLFEKIEVPDEE